MHWFAIQTKPNEEDLAAAQTAKLEVEVFLPRIKRYKPVCGVSRRIIRPLFPGYFFARFVPEISMDSVRFSLGVLRVVGTRGLPVPIEPEIISGIRQRAQPNGLIKLDAQRFKPGDTVRIEEGPFGGFIGKVEQETDEGRRVAILLEAIYNARLVVERRSVATAVLA
jgi:transcriptional antiterminator RfaH